jgi:hypothetical protein
VNCSRPRLRVLFVVVLALVLAGCGGGGDKNDAAKAAQRALESDLPDEGPLVLVDEEGRLSALLPDGTQAEPAALDAPAVSPGATGVAVRARGIAFFQTDGGGLLMVDAFARTAKVIGNLEEAGGSLHPRDYHGGGRRFVAFTNDTASKGLIVDIQAGTSRPVSDFQPAGEDDVVVGDVRISSNGQFLFVGSGNEVRLVPLHDGLAGAGPGKALPADKAYFNRDATALFTGESVDKPAPDDGSWQRVRRIPLNGAAEEVLIEKADSFLGVAGDAALIREGDSYSLISHPGDARKVDFGLAEGEVAFLGWNPVDGGGLAVISKQDDRERQRYAYLDPKTATVKHLDALDGFRLATPEPTKRFLVLSNIQLPQYTGGDSKGTTGTTERTGNGQYAIVDLVTGEFRTATFDLGDHQQNVLPLPSPDGIHLGLSHSNEQGDFEATVIFFDGSRKSTAMRGAAFAGWSPSGKSHLTARPDEATKTVRFFIVVGGGLDREVATATQVVWTAR